MTAEQKFLLRLLRLALRGERLEALPEDAVPDWKALYQEAYIQTVTLPIFDVLTPVHKELPQDVYQRFFEMARRLTAGNMRIEHAQTELVTLLEQGRHPYVILKGQSAARFYPMPENRQLGDVDFLVPTEHASSIIKKMTALGYQHSYEPGDYHQVFEKPGAYMEMHMAVAGMPEGKARPAVEAFFSTVYEESIPVQSFFGSYRTPCPAHHSMILILHMQHHTVEWGIGLRHIMDWACFVERTSQEAFWQERLLPLLKQIGLFRFTAIMTKMAAIYFGSVCPDWACDAPDSVCHQMMEDFLEGGNFGAKDRDRKRSMSMLPDWENREENPGKLKMLYRILKESVIKKHPKLGKCPVLRFFLMCGRIIRFLFLFLCGKRPNLLKAANQADHRRDIYDQLHMYEPERSD